jgi:hypothetical protein
MGIFMGISYIYIYIGYILDIVIFPSWEFMGISIFMGISYMMIWNIGMMKSYIIYFNI